jgi:L-ascorbate metabolism protein UlaG (beta-lactamase superfamily)
VPALPGIGGDEPVVCEFSRDGAPVRFLGYVVEAGGIRFYHSGNMNETEAAWLCAEVGPSYVIPMHYECIDGNTGSPGHFAAQIHESAAPATVLIPPRATPLTLALP